MGDPLRLIHVAGVIDVAEARLIVDCGVKRLGFPLALDFHDEDLRVSEAASIVADLDGLATFFLITYLDRARAIVELCRALGVATVQLHGPIDAGELDKLRRGWPTLSVIKSLIVCGDNLEALVDEAACLAPFVDTFITDTFDPATRACGATGELHDWEISRRLVESCARPVILAGGLDPDNVRAAISAVGPAGVDVHTGVEGADGRKLRELVTRFVAEASAGFREQVRDGA